MTSRPETIPVHLALTALRSSEEGRFSPVFWAVETPELFVLAYRPARLELVLVALTTGLPQLAGIAWLLSLLVNGPDDYIFSALSPAREIGVGWYLLPLGLIALMALVQYVVWRDTPRDSVAIDRRKRIVTVKSARSRKRFPFDEIAEALLIGFRMPDGEELWTGVLGIRTTSGEQILLLALPGVFREPEAATEEHREFAGRFAAALGVGIKYDNACD